MVSKVRKENSMALRVLLGAVAILSALFALPALGQDLIPVKVGRLPGGMTTIFTDIAKNKGFDKKNGIDLREVQQGTIATHYAAYITGEMDMGSGGALVLQKMRSEGVEVQIVMTLTKLTSLAVITRDPSIRSIDDLKGKSMAAAMASSEYQILSTYGRSRGIVFGQDVTVVNATPVLVGTQLQAGRVEAAMTWEPYATQILRENRDYRVILTGDKAWDAMAKTSGWQLVFIMREEFLKRERKAVPRLITMFQQTQEFIRTNVDEADVIVSRTVKLSPGVFAEAIRSGRLVYEVRPAWDEKAAITEMFRIAVEQGYLPKLPDEGAIYQP